MSFEFDPAYAVYAFAAVSAILFAEGVYLLFFSATSYRNRVNRRLSLLNETVDRQAILVQLRRERGLTMGGDFMLPSVALNRLIVQSGLSIGLSRIAIIAAAMAFGGTLMAGGTVVQALLAILAGGLVLPYLALRIMRSRRQKKF